MIQLLRSAGVSYVNPTVLSILLPPGISFYTFQEVAYIVDVYHRRSEAGRSLVDYALFISLFPHLIAGPDPAPFPSAAAGAEPRRTLRRGRFFDGLMLILFGLFRKCVVADNCALLANAAFTGRLGEPSLPVLAIGTYAFAWQIYGDFSGYSDIARGSAQLLGFHFMVNFRQPYLATSLQDFWRRWHISLSTWLRDYLYIPLGGNRHGEAQTYRNLLLTMLLGGFWHGANWTFVIWGGIHGMGLAIERKARELLGLPGREGPPRRTHGVHSSKSGPWVRRIVVFHLVCLAWVFFRAQSVSDALGFLAGLPSLSWRPEYLIAFKFLTFFAVPLFCIDLVNEYRGEEYLLEKLPERRRIAVATLVFLGVACFSGNDINAFIYFQF